MDTKRCSHSHETKPITEFYRNRSLPGGLHHECKKCKLARERASRATGLRKEIDARNHARRNQALKDYAKAWDKNHPEQRRAQRAVQRAVNTGKLTRPEKCQHCNRTNVTIESHHPDYDKPLEIVWLCKRCHALANLDLIKITL